MTNPGSPEQRSRAVSRHRTGRAAGPLLLLAVGLVGAAGPAGAQQVHADPCADLGSFAVVDGAPAPRGQPLVAQPYQPCADLPGQLQPQVFIDAQVPIGTGSGSVQDPSRPPAPPVPR